MTVCGALPAATLAVIGGEVLDYWVGNRSGIFDQYVCFGYALFLQVAIMAGIVCLAGAVVFGFALVSKTGTPESAS